MHLRDKTLDKIKAFKVEIGGCTDKQELASQLHLKVIQVHDIELVGTQYKGLQIHYFTTNSKWSM